MIEDVEPNLAISGRSTKIVVDGYPFSVYIFRVEFASSWTLEVIDHKNKSYVWDEKFQSEAEAWHMAVEEITAVGAIGFMRGNNVIPLRRD